MKRLAVVFGGCAIAASGVFAAYGTQDVRIRPGSLFNGMDLGGKTKEEAQKTVRIWWESARREKVQVQLGDRSAGEETTPGQLGVGIDDVATVEQMPTVNLFGQMMPQEESKTTYLPKYKKLDVNLRPILKKLEADQPEPAPAKIRFEKGTIFRTPEQVGYKVDETTIFDRVVEALADDRVVRLDVEEAPKKITDEMLKSVTDVVVSYSTTFAASNVSRSANIKLAASKLDGVLLLPGERVSYNETVGRRTLAAGFKEAGVYLNGRHDTGVGGGICQVSTTLYNAALLSDLKIVQRQNHSMPVPYVPLGRDATVDYGNIDLVIENNTDGLIAISSQYTPGMLIFRILGKKVEGREVKIVSDGHKSWGRGEKVTVNRALAPGSRKVVEKGSMGHSCNTYRLVYENGKLVKREPLGRSYYNGAVRLIEIGPAVTTTPSTTVPPPNPSPLETPSAEPTDPASGY